MKVTNNDLFTENELQVANKLLAKLSPTERIAWAVDTFGDGLFAMTSAGVDSAVILEQIAAARVSIPAIHINTGFLYPETLQFRDELQERYGFQLHEFGPTPEQIADIELLRLWDGDMDIYSKMTKLDPLSSAIKQLNVKALISGVRADQTDNRAGLDFLGRGSDGEIRVRPLIDWDKIRVEQYIQTHNLPRNSLYKKGYESVGDRHLTTPGSDRQGREVMECGIHVVNGKVIRRPNGIA
jgi:phosphoadenosine phosphosulfate reductase